MVNLSRSKACSEFLVRCLRIGTALSEAVSSNPFILPDYDEEAYEALVDLTNKLLPFATNKVTGVFGRKGDVDPVRHLIGTGIGWAGLPEQCH